MGLLKTYFRVKSPFFSPRKSAFFSSVLINQLRFIFRQKKVGVACQKMGIGPQKMPVEHQFAHKNHKEDILLARFHQRKIFRVTKPLSANSFR